MRRARAAAGYSVDRGRHVYYILRHGTRGEGWFNGDDDDDDVFIWFLREFGFYVRPIPFFGTGVEGEGGVVYDDVEKDSDNDSSVVGGK